MLRIRFRINRNGRKATSEAMENIADEIRLMSEFEYQWYMINQEDVEDLCFIEPTEMESLAESVPPVYGKGNRDRRNELERLTGMCGRCRPHRGDNRGAEPPRRDRYKSERKGR